MEGFTGLDYPTRVPEAFEALGRWRRDGSLVHKEHVAYGLENAPKALLRLFSRENFGKQLVKVADAAAEVRSSFSIRIPIRGRSNNIPRCSSLT
jgi:hypothetical protein